MNSVNFQGHKTNTEESVVFLYTNNAVIER